MRTTRNMKQSNLSITPTPLIRDHSHQNSAPGTHRLRLCFQPYFIPRRDLQYQFPITHTANWGTHFPQFRKLHQSDNDSNGISQEDSISMARNHPAKTGMLWHFTYKGKASICVGITHPTYYWRCVWTKSDLNPLFRGSHPQHFTHAMSVQVRFSP